MSLTKRSAARLPKEVAIVELDVTSQGDLDSLADRVREHVPHLDGVLHSIGFAPESALGGNFLHTSWEDVSTAIHISTFSFKSLSVACQPLLGRGGSIVGLDFDATVAWPTYDWMGVAKAALESTSRYLARDLGPLGIRVNLVAAGPIRTMAAKSIPGFEEFENIWQERAPLGWDVSDPTAAAQACVVLFSDWLPATSGEMIHVDGGMHSQGA
jgi:enoyl-[acyl-carrier protein] reductase I